MANLRQMLKQLQGERGRTQKKLDSVDGAIAAFEKLIGTNPGRGGRRGPRGRRKLSVAARRKISRAQKARWARLRQQKRGAA